MHRLVAVGGALTAVIGAIASPHAPHQRPESETRGSLSGRVTVRLP
jgi:hypothetical protein